MTKTLIDLNNPIASDDEAMDEIRDRANRAWATVRKVASKFNNDPTDDNDIDDFDVLAVAEDEAMRFELLAALAGKIRTATPEQVAAMHRNVQGEFNLTLAPKSDPKPAKQQAKKKTGGGSHNHDHDHGHDHSGHNHDHSNDDKTNRETIKERAQRLADDAKTKTDQAKSEPARRRIRDLVSTN